ncbi:leucine repeat adapter protein 25 [Erythrolamprus reginae]|uniref:leucine repeat adapter protein 25 n=1 Tax=Erythrolamprus reginae TaxID=121349 RepID=UPI00396C534F
MSRSSPESPPAGQACALEGLPPLPKGLSGILNSCGGSWREIQKVYSKKSRIQDDLRQAAAAPGQKPPPARLPAKPANLHAALAVLRKEMVGLRQMDMSLLCQLWSLYESIQEFKSLFQDMSSSLHSEGSLAAENVFSDEEDFNLDPLSPDGPQEPPAAQQLRFLQPQNSRDQWLKDSFHIAI